MQVQHYTEYIGRNKDWELAGIYADDGISGTNTKKREGFNEMIDDCMAGKVDMIITKSISRFARNTIDCLKYVRQLKEKNIVIIFEKENINTLEASGELLLTIMASLAQQESASLSQNVSWDYSSDTRKERYRSIMSISLDTQRTRKATLSLMRKKPRPSVGFTESTWKVQASETLRMDWNGTKSRPEANDINGI